MASINTSSLQYLASSPVENSATSFFNRSNIGNSIRHRSDDSRANSSSNWLARSETRNSNTISSNVGQHFKPLTIAAKAVLSGIKTFPKNYLQRVNEGFDLTPRATSFGFGMGVILAGAAGSAAGAVAAVAVGVAAGVATVPVSVAVGALYIIGDTLVQGFSQGRLLETLFDDMRNTSETVVNIAVGAGVVLGGAAGAVVAAGGACYASVYAVPILTGAGLCGGLAYTVAGTLFTAGYDSMRDIKKSFDQHKEESRAALSQSNETIISQGSLNEHAETDSVNEAENQFIIGLTRSDPLSLRLQEDRLNQFLRNTPEFGLSTAMTNEGDIDNNPVADANGEVREADQVLIHFQPRTETVWVDDPDWYPQFGNAPKIREERTIERFERRNFSRLNLRNLDFGSYSLAGSNFDGADLSGANLSHVRGLSEQQLARATLSENTQLPWRAQNNNKSSSITQKKSTNNEIDLALKNADIDLESVEVIEQENFKTLLDNADLNGETISFVLTTNRKQGLYLVSNWDRLRGIDPLTRKPVDANQLKLVSASDLRAYLNSL